MNKENGSKGVTIKKVVVVAGCIFLAMTGLVVGATYLWDTVIGTVWENQDNWFNIGCYDEPCYPKNAGDDALVTQFATIDIAEDHTIDDLTLAGMGNSGGQNEVPSRFESSAHTAPTLTCEMVVIMDSEVWLHDQVTIVAE